MEEYLKKQLKLVPFLPFRIVTTTGKNYDVTGRNFQMVAVQNRCVFISLLVPETDPCFNREEVVSLLHVVRVEPLSLKESATG